MLLLMLLKDHWELRMDVRPESLVLTPPSGSGEAWAPSSSFSRFYSRTQGSEGLLGSGPSSLPSGEEEFKGWGFLQDKSPVRRQGQPRPGVSAG